MNVGEHTRSADRKSLALEFLRLLRMGDRDGAARLVTPGARHHNPYFSAGMPALIDAAAQAAQQAPDRSAKIKLVIGDGDYVVVHSQCTTALAISAPRWFTSFASTAIRSWSCGMWAKSCHPTRRIQMACSDRLPAGCLTSR